MHTIAKFKRFAAATSIVMLTGSALADGTVQFQNNVVTRFYFFTDATFGSNLVTSATLGSQAPDGGYGSSGVLDVGLVWGTTAASVSTIYGGTLAGIAQIGSLPGEIAGDNNFSVAGTIPGNYYYFQVYAWDSAFGDTLAGLQACVAAGGFFGAASAGAANQTYGAVGAPLWVPVSPGPPAPGTPIFGPSQNTFSRTILLDAPEPTPLLLAVTGVTGFLLSLKKVGAKYNERGR